MKSSSGSGDILPKLSAIYRSCQNDTNGGAVALWRRGYIVERFNNIQQYSEITRSKVNCRTVRQYNAKLFRNIPSSPVPIGANNAENQNRHRCRFWLVTVLSLTKCNGFPTPLSFIRLVMRHRCRVISKRHRCRSDTDLATPLSGGCSVSAVIQSKTCDSVVGCFAL